MGWRLWLVLALGVVALGVMVFLVLRAMMEGPMYRPGSLAAPTDPPAQPADPTRWLLEPGIEISHFETGQGRPLLVIHGGPGMPFTAPGLGLSALEDSYRFIYYDQRGCGGSTRPYDRFESANQWENMQTLERTLGIGAQLQDIERIRRLLGEEKLILLGHSYGAFLATLYAAEFPVHVEALVLVSPADLLVMKPGEGGSLFETTRARLPEAMRSDYDAFLAEYMNFNDLFSRSEADLVAMNERFGPYFMAALGMEIEAPVQGQSGGWMVMAQYLSMGRRHDYRPALAAVSAPALVIHGVGDLQSVAVAQSYVDALPEARLVEIEGATHFAFFEQPAQFTAALEDFLGQFTRR